MAPGSDHLLPAAAHLGTSVAVNSGDFENCVLMCDKGILNDFENARYPYIFAKKWDSNVVISTKMYLNECHNLCYYIFEYLITIESRFFSKFIWIVTILDVI